MNLINLFITGLLTENIVLNKFLGICPFIGTSDKEKNAVSMGLSVFLVVTISSIITFLLYHYLLVPTKTEYLKTIMFILVIASIVQILEIILKRYFKNIHKTLGLYLPLITTNCAVLGITLLNITNNFNLIEVIVFSVSSSLGFTLIIYIFSTIRERLEKCNVPESFKGVPIALITAFVMALDFSRFTFI
ncbi:MAG: Rnf-Nqr domain containing protein [Bacilli bacterium]